MQWLQLINFLWFIKVPYSERRSIPDLDFRQSQGIRRTCSIKMTSISREETSVFSDTKVGGEEVVTTKLKRTGFNEFTFTWAATRKLFCRTGYNLGISPDGRVRGYPDDSSENSE